MSEREHSPIEFGPSAHGVQELFALKAVATLSLFDTSGSSNDLPVTDSCELNYTGSTNKYAMRLKSALTMSYDTGTRGVSFYDSDDYVAIEFQVGQPSEQPSDHIWYDYVAVIMRLNGSKNVWVVDKNTGKDLDEDALGLAFVQLRRLGEELHKASYKQLDRPTIPPRKNCPAWVRPI